MFNPMMNPRAGQERLNELIAEAEEIRRHRRHQKQRNIVSRLRAFVVKTFSLSLG